MRFIQIIIILFGFLFSSISVEKIASNFDKPVFATTLPLNNDEIIVIEQKGIIKLIKNSKISKTPFLDISDRVHKPLFPGDERGLLGFTFDPDYNKNGYFYVNYTNKEDFTIVSRFTCNGKLTDSKTEKIILKLKQPYSNHNGGSIEFGPDNYLYISVGDGGSTGDPENRAQDLSNLFGSILRIDVNTNKNYLIPEDNPFVGKKGVKEEIWSYGLRNVWRFSFDSVTGDLIMGDVGQHEWEEINFEFSDSKGGENYGWNVYEGNHCYPQGTECVNLGYVSPIFEYPNNANYVRTLLGFKQKLPNLDGCSVTGGYVYRGKKIENLYGRYIFGDYCTGKIWSLDFDDNSNVLDIKDHTEEILKSMGKREFYLSSFGIDNDNELFVIDYNGTIYRLSD